jgi:hypothetical protein
MFFFHTLCSARCCVTTSEGCLGVLDTNRYTRQLCIVHAATPNFQELIFGKPFIFVIHSFALRAEPLFETVPPHSLANSHQPILVF